MTDQMSLAEWPTAKVNDLPDASFLYIAAGGETEDGKTKPRSLRYFPFKDAAGKVDLPHLRNAISRIPQSTAPGLTKEKMRALQEKARELLRAESEDMGEGREELDEKAKKKKPRSSEVGGGPGGSRRYYADVVPVWGAPYLLADGPQSWVEVVRSGTFHASTGGRQVTLTDEDIYSMAHTYEQVISEGWFCEDGAPVGYNHASAHGQMDPESTKAAARVQQVEVRSNSHGGVSLWGLFSWTDEGAGRIDAGEFASISAELVPPGAATSKLTGAPMGGWTLVGATLTNSPFVPGMQTPSVSGTLAASESLTTRIYLTEAGPAPKENPRMSDAIV